jgi:hypothetical protein
MIISDEKKFIFLHNPKAAGTSVRKLLIDQYDTRQNFFWGLYKGGTLNRTIDKAHMSLADFKVLFPGDFDLLDEYFVFAFVRNPFERYVSSFFEFVRHHRKDLNLTELSMEQIVEMLEDFTRANVDANSIRYDVRFRHFIPQHQIIYCENKCKVDYIGRVEILNAEIGRIKKIIGVDINSGVPYRNKQAQRFNGLHSTMSERMRKKIIDLYEKDFWYFGFSDEAK